MSRSQPVTRSERRHPIRADLERLSRGAGGVPDRALCAGRIGAATEADHDSIFGSVPLRRHTNTLSGTRAAAPNYQSSCLILGSRLQGVLDLGDVPKTRGRCSDA